MAENAAFLGKSLNSSLLDIDLPSSPLTIADDKAKVSTKIMQAFILGWFGLQWKEDSGIYYRYAAQWGLTHTRTTLRKTRRKTLWKKKEKTYFFHRVTFSLKLGIMWKTIKHIFFTSNQKQVPTTYTNVSKSCSVLNSLAMKIPKSARSLA